MKRLLFSTKQQKLLFGAVTGLAFYKAYRNLDYLNDIGIVRFARVGVTVSSNCYSVKFFFKASIMMCDYKWTMMGMNYENKEYTTRINECHKRGAK